MKVKIPEYIDLRSNSLLSVDYSTQPCCLTTNNFAELGNLTINSNLSLLPFTFNIKDTSVTYNTYGFNNERTLSGKSLYLDIDMTDTNVFKCTATGSLLLDYFFYTADNIYGLLTPQEVGALNIRGTYLSTITSSDPKKITMGLTSLTPTSVATGALVLGSYMPVENDESNLKLNPTFLFCTDLVNTEQDSYLDIIGGNIAIGKDLSINPYMIKTASSLSDSNINETISYSTGCKDIGFIQYSTTYVYSGGSKDQDPSTNSISFYVSVDSTITFKAMELDNTCSRVFSSFKVERGSTELLSSSLSYFKTYSATSALLETPYSKVNLGNDVTGLGQISVSLTQGLNQPPVEVFRFYNDRLMPRSDNTTDLGHQDLCYRKVYTRSVDSGSNDLSLNVGGNLNINSPVVLNGTLNGVVLNSNSFEFNSTYRGITLPLFSCVEAIYETISSYGDSSHTDINSTGGSSGTGISQLKSFLGNSGLYYNVSEAFPYNSYFGNASGYISGAKITSIQSTEVSYPPDASGPYSNPTRQTRLYYITPYKSSYYIPITSVGKYRIRVLGTQYPINRISSSAWSECSSSNGVIYNNYGGVQTVLGSVPDISNLCKDTSTLDYITLWKKSYYDSGTGRTWYLYCQSVRCLIFRYE